MTTTSAIVNDFDIEKHGSVVLLRPVTSDADSWVSEHIPDDAMHFAGAVVVEPRYVGDLLAGICRDGLTYAMR